MNTRNNIFLHTLFSILLIALSIASLAVSYGFAGSILFRYLLSFLLFFWGVRGCNFAVRAFLAKSQCPTEISGETTPWKQGFAIGVLERFLIITIVLLGRYEAIGWIVAAKALARHEIKGESSISAECFLIGTLSSFSFALLSGLLIRSVSQV